MSVTNPKLLPSPFPARKKRKPVEVTVGSVRLQIYPTSWTDKKRGRIYRSHTITWHDGITRRREKRATLAEASERAQKIGEDILTGQTLSLAMRPADQASYFRCLELAAGVDAPLEVLVAEAVEARQRASRATFVPKTCPVISAELLATKRREKKCGEKWLRNLAKMLDRIALALPGPLHLARAADFNRFLRALPGGLVYRAHCRAALVQLVRYARAADYLPRDWDELKLVDEIAPAPVQIIIWSPAQLTRLLAHAPASLIPFAVCQAFAGIRHEELRPDDPRKIPLDWSDFNWEQAYVEIRPETGKTGARIIPLSDNLVAWLKPYRQTSGPVCELLRPDSTLGRAKRKAGLPAGKGQSRNVLRKSFGSYRLAVVKHIGQVADEMGNSPAKIKSNYRKPRPEREGKAWFAIVPTDGDIRQMRLSGV